ncbi:MAG: Type 1 glutamine amidotransferase-like domain-containing protein [Candidatus Pacebacteria bacterium]|nr:Type 1 glutamine amidotransferase-like domain-containing protein [Candidatus Paceibacterota bacterium]
MKLFLTSAGLPPETTEEFLKLLVKKPEETKVCFIATASHPEENKWYVEKDKERLLELGFKITELDLKEENENSLTDKLKDFDVIFVEGGNTFYLLKYVRESGFDKALKLFLERGGIYLGVSAGTIITGPNIDTAWWKYGEPSKNKVGIRDLTGLNLVPFLTAVHINEANVAIIRSYAGKSSYKVVALTDNQAILVQNGEYKLVGEGEKYVFNTNVKL